MGGMGYGNIRMDVQDQPDDWPAGVYPLRKNFVVPKRDSRKA